MHYHQQKGARNYWHHWFLCEQWGELSGCNTLATGHLMCLKRNPKFLRKNMQGLNCWNMTEMPGSGNEQCFTFVKSMQNTIGIITKWAFVVVFIVASKTVSSVGAHSGAASQQGWVFPRELSPKLCSKVDIKVKIYCVCLFSFSSLRMYRAHTSCILKWSRLSSAFKLKCLGLWNGSKRRLH